MTNNENKVQFGLKNVHYAKLSGAGYGTPVAIPGAVNLSLSAEGELQKFYADNMAYYVSNNNLGYSGDLEVAMFPDQMLQDIWGYSLDDTDKVLTEKADTETQTFALLFQIEGDKRARKYCMYACTATRPGIGSKTKEETSEPQTQSVSITAVPTADGKVYTRTTEDTPETVLNSWFTAVYSK